MSPHIDKKDFFKSIAKKNANRAIRLFELIFVIELFMFILQWNTDKFFGTGRIVFRNMYITIMVLSVLCITILHFLKKKAEERYKLINVAIVIMGIIMIGWSEFVVCVDYRHLGVFDVTCYIAITVGFLFFMIIPNQAIALVILINGGSMVFLSFSFAIRDGRTLAPSANLVLYIIIATLGTITKYRIEMSDFEKQRVITKRNNELFDANERILTMKDAAETSNVAKSQFLANMSHEIRTPINAILGMDEMILRESSNPDIINYAANIQSSGRNLLQLINDILDVSKIESGKLEIVPTNYDLAELVSIIVNEMKARAKNKAIEVNFEVAPTMPYKYFGDSVRIKQIITNIMTNAIKYTEKGSVTLYLNGIQSGDNYLIMISVIDTGIGIKPEDMDNLFKKFTRLDMEKNRTIEGTGLGLSITKQLVDLMDGTIDVQSVYGQGSNFAVTIPQTIVDNEPIGDFKERYAKTVNEREVYKEQFIAPTADILVVDDNEMNLQVVKSLLKKTKVQLDMASSGNEALSLTSKKVYDLILMDHLMPIMDGIETFHHVKEDDDSLNHDTPIIILTANAVLGAKDEYLNEGFSGYLSKPIDGLTLESTIIQFLPDEKIAYINDELREEKAADRGLKDSIAERLAKSNVNLDEGLRYLDHNLDNYFDMADIYIKTAKKLGPSMEEYLAENDCDNFRIKIHAVKSSSKNLGAIALSEEAQRLETAAKNMDINKIMVNYPNFKEEWQKVVEALEDVLPKKDEESSDTNKEDNIDKVMELVRIMKNALMEYDLTEAENMSSTLKNYVIPSDKEKIFDDALAAMDEFDYDTAIVKLDEFLA